MTYPVHYRIEPPSMLSRVELLIRLVAFCVLGVVGVSFGSLFGLAFIVLPVIAAVRTSGGGGASYVAIDGPRIVGVLRWFAAVSAWFGLVSDRLPSRTPDETVAIEVEGITDPTPGSAMWRIVTGIPSALVLFVLGAIGGFVWIWAALSILITQRIGRRSFHYLAGLQRWSIRLLAYQASLVDEYPPFSFADDAPHDARTHAFA